MHVNLRFSFLVFISFLFSCTTMTPHENFKDTLFLLIGDDSEPLKRRGWGTNDTCLESLVLPNGNTQKKYLHRGSCIYFFEIEKTTKKIVNTGFEGSEKDCELAP